MSFFPSFLNIAHFTRTSRTKTSLIVSVFVAFFFFRKLFTISRNKGGECAKKLSVVCAAVLRPHCRYHRGESLGLTHEGIHAQAWTKCSDRVQSSSLFLFLLISISSNFVPDFFARFKLGVFFRTFFFLRQK